MDRILQEISVVGRRLEGMDNAMASLTVETKSIHLDIAGFQSRVLGLEQRVSLVEAHATSSWDRDQELLYLHSKLATACPDTLALSWHDPVPHPLGHHCVDRSWSLGYGTLVHMGGCGPVLRFFPPSAGVPLAGYGGS
ncbi:hypothetical protein NDU88_002353 [Pleurodeles waltl]|uniref:Uncharacterized protein n=1 Tax=Pleurodeles waltl TaxID=8319 RepID=A0AAV7VAA4_PLEWA|nr:hypothetical protein NDU88_002353 [Pleurodeles waltl]